MNKMHEIYKESKHEKMISECYIPVSNKRKNRSPGAKSNEKKARMFSTVKAGKAIFKQLRNRGLNQKFSSSFDDEDFDLDTNDNNKTVKFSGETNTCKDKSGKTDIEP